MAKRLVDVEGPSIERMVTLNLTERLEELLHVLNQENWRLGSALIGLTLGTPVRIQAEREGIPTSRMAAQRRRGKAELKKLLEQNGDSKLVDFD